MGIWRIKGPAGYDTKSDTTSKYGTISFIIIHHYKCEDFEIDADWLVAGLLKDFPRRNTFQQLWYTCCYIYLGLYCSTVNKMTPATDPWTFFTSTSKVVHSILISFKINNLLSRFYSPEIIYVVLGWVQ